MIISLNFRLEKISPNLSNILYPRDNLFHRFQQYAEESTRSTFRVVETVLHTFSSITMLLESTYVALTSSFRAFLSVADNIGRLRSTLGQLLSTFALIRVMKWIYRKILFMLGELIMQLKFFYNLHNLRFPIIYIIDI